MSTIVTDVDLDGKSLAAVNADRTITGKWSFATRPAVAGFTNGAAILTLPTMTDTLVGRDTIDTLTNKTLIAPTVNAPTITDRLDLTAAGQVIFPATQLPSANPNTLDDYEEGSWTPGISSSGLPTSGQAYSVQFGRYIKVGKLVTCWGYVSLTAKGTLTGSLQIIGFPFVADVPANYFPTGSVANFKLATPKACVALQMGPNSAVALVLGVPAGGATEPALLTTTDVIDATFFLFTLSYQAAA